VETTNDGVEKIEEQFSLLSYSNEVKEDIVKKETISEEVVEEETASENIRNEDIIKKDLVSEEVPKEEVITPKDIEFNAKEEGLFIETALEIRCSSSNLYRFPLKSGNLPKNIEFGNSVVVGHTNIKIGEYSIPCYLNSFSNDNLTYLEIKNREFKLGFSVILKDDTIEATNEYFFYEMSKGLNHIRSIEVLKILDQIFSGVPIVFNVKKLFGKLEIENWVELIKIKTVLEIFTLSKKNKFKIQMNKLLNIDNVFYKLNLMGILNKSSKFNTWCNLKIDNSKLPGNKKVNISDSLRIKRILPFNNKISIEETIDILEPIGSWEVREDKIISRKKKCVVTLKKLRSGDVR